MKYLVILFTFVLVAMTAVNAGAAKDSISDNQLEQALVKYDEFKITSEAYQPIDSLLKARYVASVDSFIHIEQIKRESPHQYMEGGILYVEDKYRIRETKKQLPITQQGFNAWIEKIRKQFKK